MTENLIKRCYCQSGRVFPLIEVLTDDDTGYYATEVGGTQWSIEALMAEHPDHLPAGITAQDLMALDCEMMDHIEAGYAADADHDDYLL